MSVNMGERAGLTGSEKWVTEGAFHLSELTGQTIHFFLVIGQWVCSPGWGRISTTGLTIIGNNGFAFSEELLELGLRFSGF